jgi:hypothetical protein
MALNEMCVCISPSWSGDDGGAGGCDLRGRRGEYKLREGKEEGKVTQRAGGNGIEMNHKGGERAWTTVSIVLPWEACT